jgi:hypothetical protein
MKRNATSLDSSFGFSLPKPVAHERMSLKLDGPLQHDFVYDAAVDIRQTEITASMAIG